MKNGDLPAMPVMDESTQEQYNGVLNIRHSVLSYGLTKREMFAMAAMQGLLSNATLKPHIGMAGFSAQNISECAVVMASALLAELESAK